DLDTAKLEQERAKESAAELFANLDAIKAEQDEAVDNVEAVVLRTPACAYRSSMPRLPSIGCPIRASVLGGGGGGGEASELCTELNVARVEVAALHSQAVDLGAKEVELLAKLEASQAKITWLQAELEASLAEMAQLQVGSSQGTGGNTSVLASGLISGESRSLIVLEYLHSDAY
ncbi:hypothetical protein ACLOJK_036799, partial [Asimina triloba]